MSHEARQVPAWLIFDVGQKDVLRYVLWLFHAVRMKRFGSIVLLAVLLVGCSGVQSGAWTRSEMYFGLQRRDGSAITEQEWKTFVEQVVTPRFPAGLTVFDGAGQWRNASGRIDREPSKVLVILHPSTDAVDAKIDEVRRIYCERFDNEAVMKVTSAARVAF